MVVASKASCMVRNASHYHLNRFPLGPPPTTTIRGKMVLHKTGLWRQIGWRLLLWIIEKRATGKIRMLGHKYGNKVMSSSKMLA